MSTSLPLCPLSLSLSILCTTVSLFTPLPHPPSLQRPPSHTHPYSSTLMQTFMECSVTGTKRTKRATMGGSRSLRMMS